MFIEGRRAAAQPRQGLNVTIPQSNSNQEANETGTYHPYGVSSYSLSMLPGPGREKGGPEESPFLSFPSRPSFGRLVFRSFTLLMGGPYNCEAEMMLVQQHHILQLRSHS